MRQRGGECRSLRVAEPRCRDTIVGAARGIRAPHAWSPLRHVQIQLHDALFGQRELEAHGGHRFLELSQHGARRREVEILGELLGDRTRATMTARRPRLTYLDEIDAVMRLEA